MTAVVTLSDQAYFEKAKNTITDVRTRGQWTGTIVYIAVDFDPPNDFLTMYDVQVAKFPRIHTEKIIETFTKTPLTQPTHDGREFKKLTQWEKLHVFDNYFKQWNRVIFFDAGLRVLDSLENFLCLDWKGKFLALDDAWNDPNKKFNRQLETVKQPEVLEQYIQEFGKDVLDGKYFLNCMWVCDTSLPFTKEELIQTMNTYPLWRTNEMGVMNTIITFKYRLWTPFPIHAQNGKFLFDWCEYNRPGTRWDNYCALKYAATL